MRIAYRGSRLFRLLQTPLFEHFSLSGRQQKQSAYFRPTGGTRGFVGNTLAFFGLCRLFGINALSCRRKMNQQSAYCKLRLELWSCSS